VSEAASRPIAEDEELSGDGHEIAVWTSSALVRLTRFAPRDSEARETGSTSFKTPCTSVRSAYGGGGECVLDDAGSDEAGGSAEP